MSKEELLKYLIAEIDLIMHDKDYRFENANGTWYSRESCRDLTNEEVFEELRTELRQFADLEAKLAEKEKQLENAQNLKAIEVADELSLKLSKIHNQDKISFTIDELEKVKELLNTDFESTISWIDSYEDGEYLNSMTYNHNNTIKIIDNQIKAIKEGK